jgi:uncharacterized membrane protein (UPF0127 family)
MNVVINGKKFQGEYLTEPEDLIKGMMDRTSLDGCMVFNVGKGYHSFWMKNTKIFLDIVFVSNNKITKIHHNCEPAGNKLNPPRYSGIGDYVIEFNGGTSKDWKIGDRVFFIK